MSNRLLLCYIVGSLAVLTVPSLGCHPCCTTPTPTTPVVASITPSEGLAGVPIRVTIRGTGFLLGASVSIDGHAEDAELLTNGTSIGATTPPHPSAGFADVVVINPNGQIGTLTAGFRYSAVTLTATPTSVAPGGTLSGNWVAPGRSAGQGDWVGLFKVGDPNTTPVWRQVTTGASGTFTLSAPAEPGEYEFRYLIERDSIIDFARSTVITVTAAPHTPSV